MARKNTCKYNEIKRRLSSPMNVYEVHLLNGDLIHVGANVVEERDDSLEFRIMYENNDEEIVAGFKEWSYFLRIDRSFKEKIDGIARLCREGEV